MATKQQVREQITKVIQEGVLTQVLPFTSSDDVQITITAENYQTIVSGGQTGVGTAAEGEQTIIYEQDFQTAENEFNRFVDDIADCYKNEDEDYETFDATFGTTAGHGISYSFSSDAQTALADAKITQNITAVGSFGCTASDLQLEDALVAITQFQSLNLTSTQIDPTQAEEILDTTIFELLPQQSTKQERINNFFNEYALLKASPPDLITDDDGDGVPDVDLELYDSGEDISNTNPIGSIVRLDKNAGDVNKDQTLEWLRNDLNSYFLDDIGLSDEQLPIYQERSSGYLKFREMNQAIIIRNTENQQVIPDNWETTGFTITQWVKFKDKVSGGTLFNYGNPLRMPEQDAKTGFMLETYVLNKDEDNVNGHVMAPNITNDENHYENWGELSEYASLNYFENTDVERFIRLVVRESTPHAKENGDDTYLRDSHTAGVSNSSIRKFRTIPGLGSTANRRFINSTNVPIDFNEWYFVVATYDPFINEDTSFGQTGCTNNNNCDYDSNFWMGNQNPDAETVPTHYSGLGNRCKVEIISKTELLRARGYGKG